MGTKSSLVRSINFLLIAVVAVFSLLFGAVIVRISSDSIVKQRDDSLRYISEMIAIRMQDINGGMEQMRSMLMSSPYIRRFLAWEGPRDNPEYAQIARQADSYINDVYEAYRMSSHIYCGIGFYKDGDLMLVRTDHETYFSESLILPENVEAELERGNGEASMIRYMRGGRDIYSIFRVIYNPKNLQRIGILEVAFDIGTGPLLPTDANLVDTQLYIIAPKIGLLSKNRGDKEYESLLYKSYLAGESSFTYINSKYQIYCRPTGTIFGDVLLVYSSGNVLTDTVMFFGYSILFLFSVSCVVAVVSTSLAKRVMRPIRQLTQVMDVSVDDELCEEDLRTLHVLQSEQNEIGLLSYSFEQYVRKTKEHLQSLHKLYNDQKRLELELLVSQIKPHFLYNTMESICGMAKLGYNKELYTIAREMGIFYRISLSNGEPLISVRNELRHIESYLYIEQIRKRNAFSFSIDLDESAKNNKVLKLILQPVVENCVQHGLRDVRSDGRININVSPLFDEEIGKSVLVFRITDNGKGIDPETLSRLNAGKIQATGESAHGFGVFNVNERIKLYYGQKYGVRYESESGQGSTAVITVPGVETLSERIAVERGLERFR